MLLVLSQVMNKMMKYYSKLHFSIKTFLLINQKFQELHLKNEIQLYYIFLYIN